MTYTPRASDSRSSRRFPCYTPNGVRWIAASVVLSVIVLVFLFRPPPYRSTACQPTHSSGAKALDKRSNNKLSKAVLKKIDRILKTPPPRPETLAICCMIQNETPYIAEWIAYHILIGFEHFYLYDEDSTDDLDAVLAPFIEHGWVTILRVENPHYYLPKRCYRDITPDSPARDAKWLASFDVDEFLLLPGGNVSEQIGALPRLLPLYEENKCGGVLVDRLDFGSGPHIKRPRGLAIENFTERKIIPKLYELVPKTLSYQDRVEKNYVHRFTPLQGYQICLADVTAWRTNNRTLVFEPMRIQSYQYRSKQECLDKVERRRKDNPTDWRAKKGEGMCELTVHGGKEYDPSLHVQDLSLSASEWPATIRAFLSRLKYLRVPV